MAAIAGTWGYIFCPVDVCRIRHAGYTIVTVTGGAVRNFRTICSEQVKIMVTTERIHCTGYSHLVAAATDTAAIIIPVRRNIDAAVTVTVDRTAAASPVRGRPQRRAEHGGIESNICEAIDMGSADGGGRQCAGTGRGIKVTDLTAVALVEVS